MDYSQLEAALLRWCQSDPNLLAAVIVGSRARPQPADDLADLDVILFTPTPEAYAADPDWISRLGPAWLTYQEPTGAGDPEWFALFPNGVKADLVFLRAAPARDLSALMLATPYRNVFRRGLRVLYDSVSPLPAPVQLPPAAPWAPPSAEQFSHQIAGAFFAVNKAARMLARGEVWRASTLVNCALKSRLLTVIEWHARAASEPTPPDTWHEGRQLPQWGAPEVVAALPATYGGFQAQSLWSALQASLDLYCELAQACATRWNLPYPAAAEANLRQWLQTLPILR